MKKIAFVLGNKLFPYRFSFFQKLSEYYQISIFTSSDIHIKFAEIIYTKTINFSLFNFQPDVLFYLNNKNFDKVVVVGNFSYISNFLLFLLLPKTTLVSWGFWETNSFLSNKLRILLSNFCSCNILYSDSHLKLFSKCAGRFIVAQNTVDIVSTPSFELDNSFKRLLFIGTFNERKGLDKIIYMFHHLSKKIPYLKLDLVGDGPCYNEIKSLVSYLNLNQFVKFHGRINDIYLLSKIYSISHIEISPFQAGLSVPRALGHGVPFATLSYAISGGEIDSIIDNYNGFKKDSIAELETALHLFLNDTKLIQEFKNNSFKYYKKYLSLNNMVSSFREALC